MEFLKNTPEILQIIATIILAYFTYNQYSKNKKLDLKIDLIKKDDQEKRVRQIESIAVIYSELYRLLHNLQVDRVYILQPHPLINNLYVTISLEVKRKGVSPMLGQIQRLPMGEIASFVGALAKENWIHYDNIELNDIDKKAKAIMSMNGTTQCIIKRMSDQNDRWIGSLFIENTDGEVLDYESVKLEIAEIANNIQFIIPEYQDLTL